MRIKRLVLCLISIIALVVVDQVTKLWAVARLMDREAVPVIKDVLELHYLNNGNTGAAFGMLKGHQMFFLIIATVLCLLLLYIIYNLPDEKKFKYLTVIFTFIIAGGIGNMIDRIRLKYVIDFIYIKIINFPIFNVADMYVSVSTVILLLMFLFYYKDDEYTVLENIVKKLFKIKTADKLTEKTDIADTDISKKDNDKSDDNISDT